MAHELLQAKADELLQAYRETGRRAFLLKARRLQIMADNLNGWRNNEQKH